MLKCSSLDAFPADVPLRAHVYLAYGYRAIINATDLAGLHRVTVIHPDGVKHQMIVSYVEFVAAKRAANKYARTQKRFEIMAIYGMRSDRFVDPNFVTREYVRDLDALREGMKYEQ